MAILKWLLIATLAVVGVLSLFNGLGTPLPYIDSKALEKVGIPLGVVCIGVSVAMAYLWKNPEGDKR
jgi:di/tricarboxylate transporter